jgi:thioesterase domain-containing protein
VKVQGFRIELAEVESALLAHPKVAAAVAVVIGERGEDKRLVAYLSPRQPCVSTDGMNGSVHAGRIQSLGDNVRVFLQGKLPAYMVPTEFVLLDALPLTANGKVDRQALIASPVRPAPAENGSCYRNGSTPSPHGAPQPLADFEQAVTQIIRDLAGASIVGVHDNFFDLGISSLGIVRLQRRLREMTGHEVEIPELFEHPSVRLLSTFVLQNLRATAFPTTTLLGVSADLLPIAPRREQSQDCVVELRKARDPRSSGLFFLPDFTGTLSGLHPLVAALEGDYSCFGLQPTLLGEVDPVQWSRRWVTQYEAAVRARQQSGPYLLVGHSMGGPFALELAKALADGGREHVAVALLDSRPHDSSYEAAAIHELAALDFISELRGSMTSGLDSLLSVLGKLERAARMGKIPAGMTLLPMLQQLAAWERLPAHDYSFPVLLLRGETPLPADSLDEDEAFGWTRYCHGEFKVQLVPGDHFTMVSPPHVRTVVDRLEDWLQTVPDRCGEGMAHERLKAYSEHR